MPTKRMLIVDDKESIREVLRDFFESEGFDVFQAADGAIALEIGRTERFDVVLVDLKMPPPDGLEVLKELRHICPETAVLILTGYPSNESVADALRLGCNGYVGKPIELKRLKELVHEAMVKRKWQLEHENVR